MRLLLICILAITAYTASAQSVMLRDTTTARIDSLFRLYESQNGIQSQITQTVQSAGGSLRNGVIVIVSGLLASVLVAVLVATPNKVKVTTAQVNGHNTTYNTTEVNSYSPLSPRQYAGIGLSGFGGALMLGGIIQIGIAGSKMSKLNIDL